MKTLCRYFLIIATVVVFTAAQEASALEKELQKLDVQKWIQWVQDIGMWDIAPNGELIILTTYNLKTEMLYFTIHTMFDNHPVSEEYRPQDKIFPEQSIHLEWIGPDGNGYAYVAALKPRAAAFVQTTLKNLRRKGGVFFAGEWEYCEDFIKPLANNECAEIFHKYLPFLFSTD